MKTKKITLAIFTAMAAFTFSACNGSGDKANKDSQTAMPAQQSQTAGNDTSHTTDNRREEVGGVAAHRGSAASGNTNANQTVTAQGMTGADSVYQKSTQKSPK
ncbi:hypothetical protein [Mucilaginibacter sp.]|uniref:hypothetical protein n=1 Tax=Mucilaginibacter sp. TaxID=1882438 RepID=UPI003B00AF40